MTIDALAERLGAQPYVLLTTFRRSGVPVATPVWVARDGATLVVWTVTDSWKVKRIRNNPKVLVAPCTMRGKPLGSAVEGTAKILSTEESRSIRRLISKKYWLSGPITLFFSRLRRGEHGTVGLRIELAETDSA